MSGKKQKRRQPEEEAARKAAPEEEAEREAAQEAASEEAAQSAAEEGAKAAAAAAEEEEGLRDRFVRLQADFANFRKRVERERAEIYQRANEDLFRELLSVLDHFEMGLKTAEEHHTDPAVLDGFRMVYDQFQKVLEKFNLTPIDAVGEAFDPHKHEALTHQPSEEYPEGVCSHQVRRGYMFGDKLLRAAQVVVSSGSPEGGGSEEAEAE